MFDRVRFALFVIGSCIAWPALASSQCDGEYYLRELKVERLQVSNQDAGQLIDTLSTMGYDTVKIDPNAAQAQQPGSGTAGVAGAPAYPGIPGTYPQTPYVAPGTTYPGYPSYPTLPTVPGTTNPASPPKPADQTPIAKKYSCDELPVVVMPPAVPESRLGFTAADFLGLNAGSSSSSTSSVYGASGGGAQVNGDISPALHSIDRPNSSDVDQLLIFYHEGQEAQMNALKSLVTQNLDVPATQIYIEGLVLEVSENALQELGVEYDRTKLDLNHSYSVGTLNAAPVSAGGTSVVNIVRDSLLTQSGAADRTLLQLQALVSKGNAEVLSRPSVLTLSNRQATIQIIDIVQFPIQQATITGSGQVVQSGFQFEAVRPGITLNLRPRVSSDLKSVSMEIDVTVEALVSANNGQVRSSDGTVIATKPGSSTRRVETFARIPDRTPIIIGGLIASDREKVNNRVPLLGKIPIIGKLFGASNHTVGKREVIIVLTPYIVGDKEHANVSEPKDTSLFDTSGATLFQDSYRIRTEDVYDLQFLLGNPEYQHYEAEAQEVGKDHPDLAGKAPFKDFLGGNIPGGDKLVDRMVYDLVRRRHFGSDIDYNKLIVLAQSAKNNTQVSLVRDLAKRLDAAHGKWLYIVFPKSEQGGGLDQSADISVRPAGDSWSQALWEASYGSGQSAIIVRDKADLQALVDATISSAIIQRNGGYDQITVGDFKKGRLVAIPSFDTNRFYVVDKHVAKVYTDVQHYYRAISNDVKDAYQGMDQVMRSMPESSK